MSVSAIPPPSLVSALCNFSEREGSQRYTPVYFNTQFCYDVMSFVCSYAPTVRLTIFL